MNGRHVTSPSLEVWSDRDLNTVSYRDIAGFDLTEDLVGYRYLCKYRYQSGRPMLLTKL